MTKHDLKMSRSDFEKLDDIIYSAIEDMFSGLFDIVYDALISDLENNINIIEDDEDPKED